MFAFLFSIVYLVFVVAVTVYFFMLLTRLTAAQERTADASQEMARALREMGGKAHDAR